MAGSSEDNRGPQIVGVGATMIALCTLAVALRFWARATSGKAGYWWDDWTALAALPFVLAISGGSVHWVSLGFGKHSGQTPASESSIKLILVIGGFVYNTGLSLIKASLLLFYARIFGRVRRFRIALWVAAGIIFGWFISINLVALLTCIPVHKAWKPEVPGFCLDVHKIFLGVATSNVITDVILLVLPMPMIWTLRMKLAQKLALIGVFILGYCVVVVSILRVVTIVKMGRETENAQEDFSWNFVTPQILVMLEMSIALISICLPTIFGLIKRTVQDRFPTLFGSVSPSPASTTLSRAQTCSMSNVAENRKVYDVEGSTRLQGSRNKILDPEEGMLDEAPTLEYHVAVLSVGQDRR
ncbi:hypothetical protein MMC16_000485 [Acarospora aff. strigata]|nr:hypothetical protein [Acarospora aff. strigata]